MSLNGVTITPAEGKNVLVNVLGAGLLRRFEVIAGDAVATFPFKGEHLKLQSGSAALDATRTTSCATSAGSTGRSSTGWR